ncbi:MAG: HAMP domain-containing histidine kinase [Pseudonocardiales bacterium]|nr:HAMP domain-containing histidine kinase [Pseudonocardiales bacterium]
MRILRRPLTLRGRLIAALLVLSAVGLTVFTGASVLLLGQSLQNQVDQRLLHLGIRRILHNPQRLPSEYAITIFGPRGPQQINQPVRGGPVLDLATLEQHEGDPFTVSDRAGGSGWRVLALVLPEARVAAIALPLGSSVDAIVRALLVIEIVVGCIVLALVGMAATVVVALGLRPLSRIERTAEAIAGGELDRRVPEADPRTETGRLGAALNIMLGRLAAALEERARSEQRLREFVADASHELRTPLTSIRGFAELYRRGGARTPAEVELLTGRIEAEATRMGVLVEDLLLLARLNQERALDITDVDLLVLAADAVHDAKAREPDRPVMLSPGSDAVHVLGDENRLRQVVTNLVTNALTHTPAGTAVHLTVRRYVPSKDNQPPVAQAGTPPQPHPTQHPNTAQPSTAQPDTAQPDTAQPSTALGMLEVHDEGRGIPPEDAVHVFDRFHGVPRHSQGGSGLGLAITAAILKAHHGRIELHTAPRGGTTFRVLLPLA